jgi:MFS family permease
MSFAMALCALASVGFAFSDSVLTASLGRAFIGGTVAFGFVGTLAIAGYWFKSTQYALLAGLLQTVGMCGAIFGQAPLRQMVESIGWRGTMQVLALVALVLALLLFFLIPLRSSEQKQHAQGPGILKGLHAVTINPQTWICSLIGFGMAATMLAFGGLWGVPWLNSVHGYTTTEAAGVTSMIFVGWAIFSPLAGWASDRMGRRNIILLGGSMLALIALACLIYTTPDNSPLLMLLIFLIGAGGSSMTVCFGSIKELNDSRYSSTSLGLMNMCIVGSGAVMQPLVGWMLDLNWSGEMLDGARVYTGDNYSLAFTSLLILNFTAFVAALFLRETHCRQIV